MQRPRRVTDLVSSNNPTQQACALLRMVQLPLFETHVTRLWRASGPVALNEKRDGRQTWTHWDLNPGPSACEADVIPLHHVPICIGRSMDSRRIAFLHKLLAFVNCSLAVACTVDCMLQHGSLTLSSTDQIQARTKNKPPLGIEPRTFSLQD